MINGYLLKVYGIVQGVGFRPYVFNLARRLGLAGSIKNSSSGVLIELFGEREKVFEFEKELVHNPPYASVILKVERSEISVEKKPEEFKIVKSERGGKPKTLISPELAICKDCEAELFDPNDRRYRYPFINCTNCGPRFTIIEELPYDRPFTVMKKFKMCKECQKEYEDPDDRRFHAQPNACPVCGPKVFLYDLHKNQEVLCDDPIFLTAELLKKGAIVGIKGLGGFHIACDPFSDEVVLSLRKRKKRDEKPFALMFDNIETLKNFCHITPEEEKILTGKRKPIVLLKLKNLNGISEFVAPGINYLGAMLPYTPLHHLLFFKTGINALIMTSANLSDEPIVKDNEEAIEKLKGICDYLLLSDRDILVRCDDSVVMVVDGVERMIRRSRGYVPLPFLLPFKSKKVIFAAGGELKATFSLVTDEYLFPAQHIGEMHHFENHDFYKETFEHFKKIFELNPEVAVCDMHPLYATSKFVKNYGFKKVFEVQHHHAHILSCMLENQLMEPVIGISLDGTGYGTDGNVWGSEVLIVDKTEFKRFYHLPYLYMPGGDRAVYEPWRMALSLLYFVFENDFLKVADSFELSKEVPRGLYQNVTRLFKSKRMPKTCGTGRYFDAMSALLNIKKNANYDGQPAMLLEQVANNGDVEFAFKHALEISKNSDFKSLLKDLALNYLSTKDKENTALLFHFVLMNHFAEKVLEAVKETGVKKVCLTGGSFQNRILLSEFRKMLEKHGLSVYSHSQIPTNDGGISAGQAYFGALLYQTM